MTGNGGRGDEMRQVTALFADIVGSTGLGERLGPDEVKALIGECVSRMSRAVEGFGGMIQAYMGDGICAYFGVPVAHEEDPERAARAGLRILRVVGEYAAEIEQAWGISSFNVRVGINSGPTAVGLVGGEEPQAVALGDTTNVAARLQSAAEPGTIAVGEATAKRLRDLFVLEPLGDVTVKGRAEPVPAWRVLGPRPLAEPGSATPLVDRERETGTLRTAVADLQEGRGQVLLVVGDAGLGKTRTLSELRAMIGEGATWLEGRCASYGDIAPYGPFLEALRTWAGVEEGEPDLAVRTRLRARVAAVFEHPDDVLPYLGLMLGVRLDPDVESALLPLSADELATRMQEAFVTWVEILAARRPLALAVDDLHWADEPTRDLAEQLLAVTDRAPLMLVATLRPDPSSEAWRFRLDTLATHPHRAVEVPLPPLSEEASAELVDAIVPPGLLGEDVRAQVIARAEGNPLYMEELLRALLEAGGVERTRTWTLRPGSVTDLPPALESLLVARIDRLPAGPKRLAQVASVIGRVFPVSVLRRLRGSGETDRDLAVLLRTEVVRELHRYPELECTFRHGLLQEAALSTLTPAALRELYGLVGSAFEELYADELDERAERLAFFFYRSGEPERAMPYLERSAERAVASDPARARELWIRARKLATRFGDEEAERRIDERLAGTARDD